jgi:hypothetical protein
VNRAWVSPQIGSTDVDANVATTFWGIVVVGEVSAEGDSGEKAMPAFVHEMGWMLIVRLILTGAFYQKKHNPHDKDLGADPLIL